MRIPYNFFDDTRSPIKSKANNFYFFIYKHTMTVGLVLQALTWDTQINAQNIEHFETASRIPL